MARVITRDFDPKTIGEAMTTIIGETLHVDRTLIYDIRFGEDCAAALCEWLNPEAHTEPTLANYPLSLFRTAAETVRRDRRPLHSHSDRVHPALHADGADTLLHGAMSIKSLLWFPFDFEDEGNRFSLLVFNQVRELRRWSEADLEFVDAIAELVSMAHMRMRLEAERREREEAKGQQSRLESLGWLVSGVAHDFNNLLAVVSVSTGMLERKAEAVSDIKPYVRNIRQASDAATQMCRQLMDYSGQGCIEPTRFDTTELVRQTVSMMTDSVPVVIRVETPDCPVWIKGVRPQVQQILLNFITNGLESLQGGRGEVLIRAGYRTAQEATTCGVTFQTTPDEGPLPFIEVVDTGAGMDAATQARIFDPLFTTKRTGHGLGLATVRNIVTSHHAWIGIRSSPATGTTILVMFPPSEDQSNTEDVMPSAEQPILLVERDHLVRNMCESVLTIAGFRVVSAGTVDEIASLHDAPGRSFRAAIVDATVDINLQALEHVRGSVACPVLWTGASEAVVPTQATDGLLVKPFEPEELLTSVKQLLRGPP